MGLEWTRINCVSLLAESGSGEFERKFKEISEEIIQNEPSLGGCPPIKGTLVWMDISENSQAVPKAIQILANRSLNQGC